MEGRFLFIYFAFLSLQESAEITRAVLRPFLRGARLLFSSSLRILFFSLPSGVRAFVAHYSDGFFGPALFFCLIRKNFPFLFARKGGRCTSVLQDPFFSTPTHHPSLPLSFLHRSLLSVRNSNRVLVMYVFLSFEEHPFSLHHAFHLLSPLSVDSFLSSFSSPLSLLLKFFPARTILVLSFIRPSFMPGLPTKLIPWLANVIFQADLSPSLLLGPPPPPSLPPPWRGSEAMRLFPCFRLFHSAVLSNAPFSRARLYAQRPGLRLIHPKLSFP